MVSNPVFILHHSRSDGNEYILAMSIMMLDSWSIAQRIPPTYGPGWTIPVWVNRINGIEITQPNPHFNKRGQLVYLLKKLA